jgi:hypothetical protein
MDNLSMFTYLIIFFGELEDEKIEYLNSINNMSNGNFCMKYKGKTFYVMHTNHYIFEMKELLERKISLEHVINMFEDIGFSWKFNDDKINKFLDENILKIKYIIENMKNSFFIPSPFNKMSKTDQAIYKKRELNLDDVKDLSIDEINNMINKYLDFGINKLDDVDKRNLELLTNLLNERKK